MGLCVETRRKGKLSRPSTIPATQTSEVRHRLTHAAVEDPGRILSQWSDTEMEGSCQMTQQNPRKKLDVCKKYIARPGKKPRKLTKVWSNKQKKNLLRGAEGNCDGI